MENLGFHKQKLYSLIAAGVGLIALFLPWATVSFGGYGGGSVNGLHGEGFITLLGVGAVGVACFMGDKAKTFDDMYKKVALGGFGGIILGAVIAFLNVSGKGRGIVKPGFGIYIAILAGVVGLLFLLGVIKVPDNKPKV
jgi:hypothetical protein